ncbi:MAG: tannase/feruloyl esterase family alpha/beta hydrolase [Roseiarcus sp.]
MKRANTMQRFRRMGLLVAMGSVATIARAASGHAAEACASLKDLRVENTTITAAESVPAGSFTAPNSKSYANLPAFCRVTATLSPVHDSAIRIEMWLPQDGWKGVFEGTGNGGYSGVFNYPILAAGLSRGYAVINTDEGTAPATALNGDAVVGHPVKWRDWGFRSTHLMTVAGKQIAQAFYSKAPAHAYFSGCSTGGQQALSEAQLYPADYDGVAAGAPVVNRTHLHAAFVWSRQAADRSAGGTLGRDKLMLLKKAVVAACAPGAGGVASDTFVADPLHCAFDPASLVCKAGDAPDCLTPEQVETVKRFYAGPTNPRTGEQIYPGWPRGSEGPAFGWALEEGDAPFSLKEPAFDSLFKWVFGPTWDWRSFDFDHDMAEVDAVLGPDVNGNTVANIDAFKAHGGKLLLYHGWADSIVNPLDTVAFYETLAKAPGGRDKLQGSARLFLLPGVEHCGSGGGEGPDAVGSEHGLPAPEVDAEHDVLAALAQWVETGTAPEKLIATKYQGDDPTKPIVMQRPACAYPKMAHYTGSGDANAAASFVCE